MKKLLKKFLLFLLNKLNMPNHSAIEIDFYKIQNLNWQHWKSDELYRIPNIGEKVELFIAATHQTSTFTVQDVIHRVGRNPKVFIV